MPLAKEDITDFDKKVDELVDLVNSSYNSSKYDRTSIEVFQTLRDYGDGQGHQLISCAAVRNPLDNTYLVYLDVMGTAEEALNLLLQSLQKLAENKEPRNSWARPDKMLN